MWQKECLSRATKPLQTRTILSKKQDSTNTSAMASKKQDSTRESNGGRKDEKKRIEETKVNDLFETSDEDPLKKKDAIYLICSLSLFLFLLAKLTILT